MSGGDAIDTQITMFEDEFRIKIPGEKHEHLIPGSYVRSVELTVTDIVKAYANSMNVSANELSLSEMDLTQIFTDIRKEFSVERFREEVLADAAGFVIPEEMVTRDTKAYKEAGSSLEVLITRIQADKASDRYNVERCDAMFKDDPEYANCQALLEMG
jgi:acyl carrier protein